MTITMIHNQNLTGQHWNTFHLQQKANTWEHPSKAYTPLLALNTGLALRSSGQVLAVVQLHHSCYCVLSYLPGLWGKSKIQKKCSKYREKNQSGPRESGQHFSLIPAALALRESRQREAGQCGWIHSDAVAAWREGFGAAGHNRGGSLVIDRQQDPGKP